MAGRSAIGLDLGTSGVRAAELSFGKGRVTLERFGQIALPPGAVRDGEVASPEVVAAALKELWARVRFSGKRVVLGVANQKVIVRQLELPWLPPEDRRKALGFTVQDFLPMPVDAAILDFHSVEEVTTATGDRVMRGLLVAAERDMVMAAVTAVGRAGLTPTMIDLTSFAVLRSLGREDHLGTDGSVEALVDVGARVTNVVIHQGGVPRFVRILLMGGQDVTDAVAERLGVAHGEAEAVKHELGFLPPAHDGLAAAARAIETTGSVLVEEIRGSLDYFLASSGSAPVGRLVVTGGGARLGGLLDRLRRTTRLPVEAGNPLSAVELGRTGLSPEQLQFVQPLTAVPVGLALGAVA